MDTSLKYRERFLRNQLTFRKKFKDVFDKVASDFASLSSDPNIKFSKSFKFPEQIDRKMTAITTQLHQDLLVLTETEIESSWMMSNAKNDDIINDYLKTTSTIKLAQKAGYYLPNIPALKAFLSRKSDTGTLSDAVWKIARQARAEMETHLGIGIMNGDSAQVISRRIRQYLNNPDALFRRVRDKKGKLVPSKAMKLNAPGTGVYNSAYKNAMRVTRTETNMAYLLADHLRWEKLDMVLGFEVVISEQHQITDICDDLQGRYPSYFVFTGWHPQCLCHATPILTPEQDFAAYLRGEKSLKGKKIDKLPENFVSYTQENFEKYSAYKNTPYWMADNAEVIQEEVLK